MQLNNGQYAVAVDRLYGSETNEFSMINVMRQFPANPPAETIKLGSTKVQEVVDALPIPYSFSDMAGID